MNSRKTLPAGFTIVELLIVVVVIAILATLVIVSYNGVQSRARASSAQASVQQAATKIQAFAVDNAESYPASLAAIGIVDSGLTTYQYTVDNAALPRTFCVTATVSGVNYYISQSVTNPTVGTCAPAIVTSSIFGATYPYTATYYNDGGGSLMLATEFYSNSSSFTLKGGRVYLPSVPAGASLTLFYVKSWYSSGSLRQPDWTQIPSSIPGQYVTIPSGSLVTGWNEANFPTSATINPFSSAVDGTSVWVGYYFSDGVSYVYSPSPGAPATQSTSNPHLFLAENNFQSQMRSANSIPAGGWSQALYGIDILTVGP